MKHLFLCIVAIGTASAAGGTCYVWANLPCTTQVYCSDYCALTAQDCEDLGPQAIPYVVPVAQVAASGRRLAPPIPPRACYRAWKCTVTAAGCPDGLWYLCDKGDLLGTAYFYPQAVSQVTCP